MDIPLMYSKTSRELPFGIRQYKIDNPEYLDPRKTIAMRQSEEINQKKKGRFKPSKIRKPCYMDEFVKPIKFIPGPGAYEIPRSLTAPFLTRLKPKVDMKIKKDTYIDKIIFDEKKYNKPGVGKYNLSKSLKQQREQSLKKSRHKLSYGEKISSLDNFKAIAGQQPGVGQYNLTFRRRIKPEMKDQDYYKQKHKTEEARDRAKTARPGSSSYEPIPAMFKTFSSISRDSLSKTQISRWSHGAIDKRPSSSRFLGSPGPAQHNIINTWAKDAKHTKENLNVKLFNRISKGYKPGVYH